MLTFEFSSQRLSYYFAHGKPRHPGVLARPPRTFVRSRGAAAQSWFASLVDPLENLPSDALFFTFFD